MSEQSRPVAAWTVDRVLVNGVPSAADLLDAGFVLALGLTGLWGFRTSFDSLQFIVVGAVGLLLGMAVAHIANVLRRGWLVLALMTAVTFFAFGGAVAMRADAVANILPNVTVVRSLARLSVSGWKDFLTTLPPVGGSSEFLVLPYLLGLLVGVACFAGARRSEASAWPVAIPAGAFVLVILLGTLTPASALPRGLAMALLAALWLAVRRRRRVRVVGTGARLVGQAMTGAALLTGAALVGTLGAQALQVDGSERFVLRSLVQPPFDIAQYPSPLVGYRNYTQGVQRVWDKPLFTVSGLAVGDRVRIAVLDSYSGTVWSAGDPRGLAGSGFRRVSSVIAGAPDDARTGPRAVSIEIAKGYATLNDVNLWVPGVGSATRISFRGANAGALDNSLRYNTVTGQAVVSRRLQTGDRIELTESPMATVSDSGISPGGSSLVDPAVAAFVPAATSKLVGKAGGTPWAQLKVAAASLRSQGSYSDGTAAGEQQYLPGHSVGRLAKFFAGQQPTGNDEQYASAFALVANDLGVPTRVVLGAVVASADGVVRGQDVHAWVEVKDASGEWFAVPQSIFMPDRTKRPKQDPPPPQADVAAADVPPPNAQQPPGALDSLLSVDPGSVRQTQKVARGGLPAWFWPVVQWTGLPIGLLALCAGTLATLHVVRARRRRGTGAPNRRLAQGWTEVVDRARDLGIDVPKGLTRREQAALVGYPGMAADADSAVFGAGEPSAESVQQYWKSVAAARRSLNKRASLPRRLLRPFAVTSLLLRDPRPVETVSPPRAPTKTGPDRRRLIGSPA